MIAPLRSSLRLAAIAALALGACTQKPSGRPGIESRLEVMAPRLVSQSFTATQPTLTAEGARITIARTSLEKEFLLQAQMIAQPVAAMGSGLQSRIVAFRERDGHLFLMEATQGHTVTNDLPTNLLLAEYPVVSSNDESITFDFNVGMKSLFINGDWFASDLMPASIGEPTSVQVNHSYIESAAVNERNEMAIRQIAQITVAKPNGSYDHTPIEVRYYLSPYNPDPGYVPVPTSGNFDRYGFFQATPKLNDEANIVAYASRWNSAKTVKWAISANTPPEFKQAVIDGVLYWNKVYGSKIVEVMDAPAGVTAPDMNYNVVQWVPFDDAGFAYADGQMDPRTGELLHAQVYFTSAFGFLGKAQARQFVRKLRTAPKLNKITLRGFEGKELCHREANEAFVSSIESLLASDVDDATILKAAQDYVREVSAHEIGHTMGLRHNFAGSLAANYPMSARNQMVADYFTKKEAPAGVITSSSVMEYQRFEESIITGDQIAKGNTVYDYDRKAIAMLYKGEKVATKDMPLFCTDSSYGKFADCMVFDMGASLFDYMQYVEGEAFANLPASVIERYISNKFVRKGDVPTPSEEVALPNPDVQAAQMLALRQTVLKQLSTAHSLLRVKRSFPVIGGFNADAVRAAQIDYASGQVDRVGGLEKLFFAPPLDYAATAIARLNVLLESDAYSKGVGIGDQAYTLTAEDKAVIRAYGAQFFAKLANELVKADLKALAAPTSDPAAALAAAMGRAPAAPAVAPKFFDSLVGEHVARLLDGRARTTILTQSGEVILADIEVTDSTDPKKTVVKSVRLPKFAYELEARLLAATLLAADRGEAIEWGQIEKAQLKIELERVVEEALSVSIDKVKVEKMPKSVARWVLETKKVLAAL